MQPMLMLTARMAGLFSLNGRLLGALQPGEPLYAPVAPRGVVYLMFCPFGASVPPVTGRVTLSRGRVLPDSLTDGLYAVLWPSGVVEIECCPIPGEDEADSDPAASQAPWTPVQMALSAMECVLSGTDFDDARLLLAADCQPERLHALLDGFAACVPMKFDPDGNAIGLVRVLTPRCAEIVRMPYEVQRLGENTLRIRPLLQVDA